MAVILKKIKTPIYETDIYLMIATYEECVKFLDKEYSYKIDHTEYYPIGRVIKAFHTKNNWKTTKYFLWLEHFDYYIFHYSALAHEVIHLTLMIFEAKGIPIIYDKENSNEAFCYYADYLFEQFLTEIGKLKQINYESCKEAMEYMKKSSDIIG